MNNNIGRLALYQEFMQHTIHQRMGSHTFTVSDTRLVKQHAELAVARETKFRDANIKQEPDENQNTHLWTLTGPSKNS